MYKRIIVSGIEKKFKISGRRPKSALESVVSFFWGKDHKTDLQVLKGVSFSVSAGEIIGIVGRNGSGKSTLLKILAGVYQTDSGWIHTEGRVVALLNLNLGFQERLTMKENLYISFALFGIPGHLSRQKYSEVVAFSGLSKFQNTKLFQFSQGMKERLAFSIAYFANPDILLMDEAFSVGDEGFQQKTAKAVLELKQKKCAILIVAHDLEWLRQNTKRTMWLEKGKIKLDGTSKTVIQKYVKSFT